VAEGTVDNYLEELRRARFCLAPYGAGWGIRLSLSMAYGCVPVIIQDAVYQVGHGLARGPAPTAAAGVAAHAVLCSHLIGPRLLHRAWRLCLAPLQPPSFQGWPAAHPSLPFCRYPRPQPYEDLLPYQDFSVRLPAADIPRIGDILRDILGGPEYARLRSNLPKYWPAFVWDKEHGGLAYNYTIASLRRRWQRLVVGDAGALGQPRGQKWM
jgi:hypothetical protein